MEFCFPKCSLNILFLLLSLSRLTVSQGDFVWYPCLDSGGNYTNNSPYQSNLKTALSSLPSGIDYYGFNSVSFGQNPNTVNAIALCRGDVNISTCRDCVRNATVEFPRICPNQKQAIGVYLSCMVRYSNQSIYRTFDAHLFASLANPKNVTNPDQFNKAVWELFDNLTVEASDGDRLKFATGTIKGPDFATIYGLMQCAPDLSKQDCIDCLNEVVSYISDNCCSGKEGGRVYAPSCYLRFEKYPFFGNTIAIPPPPPGEDNNKTIIIIPSTIGFGIVLSLCICIFLIWRRKRKMARQSIFRSTEETSNVDDIGQVKSLQYEFNIIRNATNNFANMLGQGGFGAVYKGRLLNGQEIAVKRLSGNSGQGEHEFKNEVMLVARLQHRNLVKLLGFSLQGAERLLIYEFVANLSLDQFIFNSRGRVLLDWDTRYRIICGIAKGLQYLHEDSRLRIIHLDMKASNVLLDGEMKPKISDFGTARLFARDETRGHASRIVGTYGYMAPEYVNGGHFSAKSDVFSYGVLILEIVAGRRNISSSNQDNMESLLSIAWRWWHGENTRDLIDPILRSSDQVRRCIGIGLLCVQENVASRPTMASVVPMLSNPSIALPELSQPGEYDPTVAN